MCICVNANKAKVVTMKDVARFLKILANESRLQILWLLSNHEELCVCDLVEALGVSQSKVSRHLATLRHTGLVVDRREKAWSYYSISPMEKGFEDAVLRMLKDNLADHPGAVRVSKNLQAWLKRKNRVDACSAAEAVTGKTNR